MKKIIKIFLGVIFAFVAMFLLNAAPILANEQNFNTHILFIKNSLNEPRSDMNLSNLGYLEGQVSVGTYQREYQTVSGTFAKKTLIKPNAFKVIYAAEITSAKWNKHFPKVTAKKRGIVVAKVLDKKTKKVYKDENGNALVYIFQITNKKDKVRIVGILNSVLSTVKYFKLVP